MHRAPGMMGQHFLIPARWHVLGWTNSQPLDKHIELTLELLVLLAEIFCG